MKRKKRKKKERKKGKEKKERKKDWWNLEFNLINFSVVIKSFASTN